MTQSNLGAGRAAAVNWKLVHPELACRHVRQRGAGVKTNLLFFTKGSPTERIWYYDLSDVKVGKKTPLTLDKFEEFLRLLPARSDSPRSWTVRRKEVDTRACHEVTEAITALRRML